MCSLLLGCCCIQASSEDKARKYPNPCTHKHLYFSVCLYIKTKHEFILVPPIPNQNLRTVQLTSPLPLFLSSFSDSKKLAFLKKIYNIFAYLLNSSKKHTVTKLLSSVPWTTPSTLTLCCFLQPRSVRFFPLSVRGETERLTPLSQVLSMWWPCVFEFTFS